MSSAKNKTDNYAAWQIGRLSKKEFEGQDSFHQLAYMCSVSLLAPSSHNSQPWRYKINSNKKLIEVFLDRSLVLPESDPEGKEAVISMGCAIEYIVITAGNFGLKASVGLEKLSKSDLLPSKKSVLVKLGSVSFKKLSGTKELVDTKSILSRKSTRAEFDKLKPLPTKVIKQMELSTKKLSCSLLAITSNTDKLRFSEMQGQADGFVGNNPKFAKELGEWIIENNTDSYNGMPGATFGMRDDAAKRLHLSLLGKIKLEPEDMMKFGHGTKFLMEHSSLIGVVSGKSDSVESWLNVGRALARNLLILESNKIQASIHAGVVEVPLIRKIFASTFKVRGCPLTVFRAGYVKRKQDALWPHAPRLPIEKVLID